MLVSLTGVSRLAIIREERGDGCMEQMRFGWMRLDSCSGHDAGRQLLAELYRQETGEECPPVLVTNRGKPYFQDSPLYFSISHTKNGIYGEMFAAAMIARAAVSDDIVDIILCGFSQIPTTSRLYEAISKMVEDYRNGVQKQEALKKIYAKYDDTSMYDWCHTISNACIVVYALLYGENDYGKSICLAVEAAFDTDCNGATVGSVLGMKNSIDSIGKEWTDVVKGKLHTNIFRCELLEIDTLVDKTIKHIG